MMIYDYITASGAVVSICPMCASMGDHDQGVLSRPASTTPRDGKCAGALHDGGGFATAEEAADAQRAWSRSKSGRRFNPWNVCGGINRGLRDGIGVLVLAAGGQR